MPAFCHITLNFFNKQTLSLLPGGPVSQSTVVQMNPWHWHDLRFIYPRVLGRKTLTLSQWFSSLFSILLVFCLLYTFFDALYNLYGNIGITMWLHSIFQLNDYKRFRSNHGFYCLFMIKNKVVLVSHLHLHLSNLLD